MIGTTVAHFRIRDKLGEGGMGEVWRAEDTRLGREVAIKVLPEAVASDPERLARFEREARVLAALDHPGIAAIYGLEEADGRQLLVMQLVEGDTLQERIGRGALPVDEALPLALQIAEALESAHERGIVHRDLKPANVKITPDGQVKVLDFGLAKALEGDASGGSTPSVTASPTLTAQMTGAGVLLGTAAYMSPEQARGQTADKRADIWAFGIVLMEMLTGRMVYSGETVSDTLAGVLAREPEWDALSADTPRRIRRLLERCLEKSVTDRLRDIGEARIQIRDFLAHPEVEEAAAERLAAMPAEPTRRRVLPWALLGLAGLGLIVALWRLATLVPPARQTARLSVQVPGEKSIFRGYGASAVLSPDGTRIAYTLGNSSESQIYLLNLDQWEGIDAVAGDGADLPYHPFFSPDGRWLGFVTRTELKKMPVTGGTPISLCGVDFGRGASWGPDDTIVFAPRPLSPLFQVPAAGGEPRPLTTLDEEKGEATHRWPQHLPGGEVVLFTAHSRDGEFDGATIEALVLRTGERKTVLQGGYAGRFLPPGYLVYVNQETLFAVPFDVDRLETTGMAAPVVEGLSANPANGGAQFSVAGNGTLAYVTGSAAIQRFGVVRVDPQGQVSPLWADLQDYAEPKFSPDGKHLAFSIQVDQNWDIWVYDLEREVPTRLTFHEAEDASPVWSPDGESIVFASERDGAFNLYRKAADGSGEAERLTESDHNQFPYSWSAGSDQIAFSMANPETQFDIWLLPARGEGEAQLFLGTEFGEGSPAFSPDGRWLAYDSNESGTREIYVRPADAGKGKWQISSGGGRFPLWSTAGGKLFYRTVEGGIDSVDIEGEPRGSIRAARPRAVVRGQFVRFPAYRTYDVAPDGSGFVMLEGETAEAGAEHDHVRFILAWSDELDRTFARP